MANIFLTNKFSKPNYFYFKIKDLKYFLLILFNFIFAFGIALQAIMFPNEPPSLLIFIKIFNISYWPVYGQIDVLDEMNKCYDNAECENLTEMLFAFLILMCYMIISSVLLINLEIAMFRFLLFHD